MARRKKLLTIDEINGAWAIMPTPAVDGASDWSLQDTVDLAETERSVNALIEGGADGLLSLGTLGECATLTWDEKLKFIETVIETARGRVPVFIGTTTLNTRDTIQQTRVAHDMGADGVMLGIPMWCAPDVSTAVGFYRDVAEACPDTAICVYANPMAFRFNFPPSFWAQVSEIPQIVTSKHIGIGHLTAELTVSKRRIRFLAHEFDYYAAARIDPEFCTGFWTSSFACGPAPCLALREEVKKAKASGNWKAAEDISIAIARTLAGFLPNGSLEEFGKYNIGLEKERMNAAGWLKAGPMRPPYHIVPEAYLEGARQAGRLWADLDRRLSAN